jgi:hypothetical protein
MTMKNGDDDRPRQAPGSNSRSKPSAEAGLRSRQRVIGAGLKRLFEDVVDEAVPEDFMALLAKFEEEDPSGDGGERR